MNPSQADTSFKDIRLSINSGILIHINETILSSFADFSGLLIGKYRKKQQTQALDSNANYVFNSLHLLIDDVVFVFEKEYLHKRFDKIVQQIQSEYRDSVIIGLFSGRSYSFPNMSLHEQELYVKLFQQLRSDNNTNSNPYHSLPLLFGAFTHNSTDDSGESAVKTINFFSKIYYYDVQMKYLSSIPYSIVNMKDTTYANLIDPISNKISLRQNRDNKPTLTEKEQNSLKDLLNHQLSEIEQKQLNQIKQLKWELKNELQDYVLLNKQLKKLN